MTKLELEATIFILNYKGEIEEMTYGEYCREFGGDETTSPNGVAPRIHVREVEVDVVIGEDEDGDDITEVQTEWQVWTWGVSGNNPRKLETFNNEDDAEMSLYEHWEYNAMNHNDNAPGYFATEAEAIEVIVERIADAEDIAIGEAMNIYLDGINEVANEERIAREASAKADADRKIIFEKYKNVISKVEGESYKETGKRLSAAIGEHISGSVFHQIIKFVRL